MRKIRKFSIGVFISLFTISFTIWASVPEVITQPVTDVAGVFSSTEEQNIQLILKQYRDEHQVEGAILTLSSLEGNDIQSLTTELLTNSGIGRSEIDSGFLLTIAPNDRTWFLGTGYGLEGALPDALIARLGNAHFSDFGEGGYGVGVENFLVALEGYISGEFDAHDTRGALDDDGFWLFFVVTLLLVWFGVARLIQFSGMALPTSITGASGGLVVMVFFFVSISLASIMLTYLFIGGLLLVLPQNTLHSSSHNRGGHWGGGASGGFGGGFGSGFGGFGGGGGGGGGAGGSW